jgi:hypothetical protein
MSERAAFVITLLPAADRDGVHDLRALLKIAGRHLHMRALSVRKQSVRRRGARRGLPTSRSVGTELTMTNLRKYGPANRWLKLETIHGLPPLKERIGLVKPDTGKFGERLVVTLEPSGWMLSLNRTSVGNLLRDFAARLRLKTAPLTRSWCERLMGRLMLPSRQRW